MIKALRFVCIITLFLSCKTTYKKCSCQSDDVYIKAYTGILNEIVEKYSYNRYLGADEEEIFKRYTENTEDTDNIDNDVKRAHNKIFDDTSKFCTLYLDSSFQHKISQWRYLKEDTGYYAKRLKNFITDFSSISQSVIDTLNNIQSRLKPENLNVCIARVKSIKDIDKDSANCYIGKISLSNIIFNSLQDRGLLYYEFKCGMTCGYGLLIMIEKKENHWYIRKSLQRWVT